MSCLCDIFFIFIFIIINKNSLKQAQLLFCTCFRVCPTTAGWSRGLRNQIIFK